MNHFVVVSKSRRYVDAATELRCSSRTLAGRIQQLEATIGQPLLDCRAQRGRALELSAFGRDLVDVIGKISEDSRESAS